MKTNKKTMGLKKKLKNIEKISLIFTFCLLLFGTIIIVLFNFIIEAQQLFLLICQFVIIISCIFLIPIFYRMYYIKKYPKDIYKIKRKYKKWLTFYFMSIIIVLFILLYILYGWLNKYIIPLILFVIVSGLLLRWVKSKD